MCKEAFDPVGLLHHFYTGSRTDPTTKITSPCHKFARIHNENLFVDALVEKHGIAAKLPKISLKAQPCAPELPTPVKVKQCHVCGVCYPTGSGESSHYQRKHPGIKANTTDCYMQRCNVSKSWYKIDPGTMPAPSKDTVFAQTWGKWCAELLKTVIYPKSSSKVNPWKKSWCTNLNIMQEHRHHMHLVAPQLALVQEVNHIGGKMKLPSSQLQVAH